MKPKKYSTIIITTSIIVFALITTKPAGLTSIAIFENALAQDHNLLT